MLTEKQIREIREHLERAQNPVFFYDNDCDGLCSFLLLRRLIGRGKGVAVKSYPDLNAEYAKKASELKADYVFILDKPVISPAFLEEIDKMQLPVVWIDHHAISSNNKEFEIDEKKHKNLQAYNPARNKGKEESFEPVTYLAYKISERKEDIWIAIMGCIADHFIPDFAFEFQKHYPEFWTKEKIKEPFDAYYRTEIGRIAQAISFGLKDSISHVVKLQNFLINCNSPNEIFLELEGNKEFREKYSEIRKKYDFLLEKAKESTKEKLIFFDYSGDLSISAEIANELSYKHHGKYIAVAYKKGAITNISLRGEKIRRILEKILKRFENANGGGHENAAGARIRTEDLVKFKEALENEINSRQ